MNSNYHKLPVSRPLQLKVILSNLATFFALETAEHLGRDKYSSVSILVMILYIAAPRICHSNLMIPSTTALCAGLYPLTWN
jgi:hypothetical protein